MRAVEFTANENLVLEREVTQRPALSAVLIFETLLNGMLVFSHANVRLPIKLDRSLRLLLITADARSVHHSILRHETNSIQGLVTRELTCRYGIAPLAPISINLRKDTAQ